VRATYSVSLGFSPLRRAQPWKWRVAVETLPAPASTAASR